MLHHTTVQVLVVSLPKPGRSTTYISGYRPLSLLTTEYKILSKVLSHRLLPYLHKRIHPDQCGFVPVRCTSLNIRRLYHVMESTPLDSHNAGCITLDLRQAFDTLRWDYMFRVLEKFGIPPDYLKWVKLLYSTPTARARTGRHISHEYRIGRGTRQGCPLSPLLFVLALEPLALKL